MRKLLSILVAGAFTLALGSCDEPVTTPETSSARGGQPGAPGSVLKATAFHQGDRVGFELSDDEIPSGWTTLEFHNKTQVTHFARLLKATPEFTAGMQEDFGEVSREGFLQLGSIPFQKAWDPYFNGEITFGEFFGRLQAAVPDWFSTNRGSGGAGLTAGGETSRTTVNLEPGIYFIECAVLGEDGRFHVTDGMVETVKVTEESSGTAEPKPTMQISLSTEGGMEVADAQGASGIRPGNHTVAVTFQDNETQGGHDLHLIRLDEGTTVQEVNDWINLFDIGPDGFYQDNGAKTSTHDDPGPKTFLGGVQDIEDPGLPETAYFHVQLKPGEYAWVAEIANPQARGFLESFTVPFGTDTDN